jgi:hypothetical protein
MSFRALRTLALACALISGTAIAVARGAPPPTEYLDEQTGATVTVPYKPLIFARERSERAANLRDYVNLLAASVNRGGKTEYVLIAYVWSTLDARYAPSSDADTLLILADDRRFPLNANGQQPSDLGIARLVQAPPGQELKALVYPVDLPTLRYMAVARSLVVQVNSGEDSFEYELWDDQRAGLLRFVDFLNGQR